MASYAIKEQQISASSQYSADHSTNRGRLNTVKTGNKQGAWSARTNDDNQWLQIELGRENTRVTRVATQGRSDLDQWVKTYKLQYSDDGENFQYYRQQGQTTDKVRYESCAEYLYVRVVLDDGGICDLSSSANNHISHTRHMNTWTRLIHE